MRLPLFALVLGLTLPLRAAPVKRTPTLSPAQTVFARFVKLSDQGQLKSTAAKSLLSGDAVRLAQVDSFGPVSQPDSFQMVGRNGAVTRVQVLEDKKPVIDFYFYLVLTGKTWKLNALRSMAMTEWFEEMRQGLLAKPKLTEKERVELANCKLLLSLDRDLRIFLRTHIAEFERIRILAAKNSRAADAAGRKLGLSSVEKDYPSNCKFVIGGMLDNTVGYIYSPTNTPPQISPEEYIWVEKIMDKWYLYCTT